MKKKNVIIASIIIVIAIVIIIIGLIYPKYINTGTKSKKSLCSVSLKDGYYDVKYNSNYLKYKVTDDNYEVIEESNRLKKVLKKIGCSSDIDVDFSKKKVVLLEVLVDPKMDTLDIKGDSIKSIVLYKSISDADKKDIYHLFLIPISRDIEKYDIRISPTADSNVKGPFENE